MTALGWGEGLGEGEGDELGEGLATLLGLQALHCGMHCAQQSSGCVVRSRGWRGTSAVLLQNASCEPS